MANAAQKARLHRITGAPYIEFAPESSLAGLCEFSGDELAGAIPGELPLDGSATGEPAGAAELEGMLAEASGVAAVVGPSATGGAPTGLLTGVAAGVATGAATVAGGEAGDETGEEPLADGLEAGETEVGE